jgi:hypothetical protein
VAKVENATRQRRVFFVFRSYGIVRVEGIFHARAKYHSRRKILPEWRVGHLFRRGNVLMLRTDFSCFRPAAGLFYLAGQGFLPCANI